MANKIVITGPNRKPIKEAWATIPIGEVSIFSGKLVMPDCEFDVPHATEITGCYVYINGKRRAWFEFWRPSEKKKLLRGRNAKLV